MKTTTQRGYETFFAIASPTTLASLIADCQNAGPWRQEIEAYIELENMAYGALVANVGQQEADELLNQYRD